MTPRRARRRRVLRAAAAAAAVATCASACGNHQNVVQGARYSDDRNELELASIMPTCACVTLASALPDPDAGRPANTKSNPPRSTANDIVVVSRLNGIALGSLLLRPASPVQVQVDWAGLTADDVYKVAAFRPGTAHPDKVANWRYERIDEDKPLTPIPNYVAVVRVLPTDCNPTKCPFATLNMNQAIGERVGQGQVEAHPRGVQSTRAGQSLEAQASPASDGSPTAESEHCGCVALRPRNGDVELRSTFHGTTLGYMPLKAGEIRYVGFDDGGPHSDDRYVIEAVTKTRTAEQNQVSSQGGYTDTTLRLSDVIEVLGELDHMRCTLSASLLDTGIAANPLFPPQTAPSGGPAAGTSATPPAPAGGAGPPPPEGAPQEATQDIETLRRLHEQTLRQHPTLSTIPCFFGDLKMHQNVRLAPGGTNK